MCIGFLGKDPEMRFTASGNPVASFSVATNRRWRNAQGEQQEETEWFNIECWNKLAENCNQFLHKGSRVYVEGRLRTRSWEDTITGQRRYRTEVIANSVLFLDRREEATE